MVEGTVTNSTGNETGVTVNGIVATVYGSQFIVNHVPLEEGLNDITASATDTAGNTASHTITVTAVTTTPYVTLNANIESGIAPLTTYFSVSTAIPNAVATYEMDYEGDGFVDFTGPTFDNINFTYNVEGIYYPTVWVTDTQGYTYSDTIAIVVLNATDLDALLRAKWDAMKTALIVNDIDGAVSYFGDFSKDKYEKVFLDLGVDLPSIISALPDIGLISFSSNVSVAEYAINRMQDGVNRLYFIYFIKDENGLWKIDSF